MSKFDYSLAGILNVFGQPSEIWLKVHQDSITKPHYEMILFNPSIGDIVSFAGTAEKNDESITICPQNIFSLSSFPPGILLWSPKEDMEFRDIRHNVVGNLTNLNPYDFRLLENLTDDINTEGFFQTYLDAHSDACFEVPLER